MDLKYALSTAFEITFQVCNLKEIINCVTLKHLSARIQYICRCMEGGGLGISVSTLLNTSSTNGNRSDGEEKAKMLPLHRAIVENDVASVQLLCSAPDMHNMVNAVDENVLYIPLLPSHSPFTLPFFPLLLLYCRAIQHSTLRRIEGEWI